MTILPFKVEHFLQLNIRDKEGFSTVQQLTDLLFILKQAGNCYSFFYENTLVFTGGIRIIREGVGEAWVLCSKSITRFVRELYYYSEKFLIEIVKKNKLVRIQAHVEVTREEACNFLDKMGFEREGLLKKCFFHTDYFIYGRIF